MLADRPRILFVGNYLDKDIGTPQASENLARRLADAGFTTWLTSRRRTKVLRVTDVIVKLLVRHRRYDVVHADVFSGRAFILAFVTAELSHVLAKPLVLTLHGGGLPSFSDHHRRTVARTLGLASKLVAPSAFLRRHFAQLGYSVELIPNGIELRAYPFRSRFEILPRLVWLRAFSRIYDPDMALDVVRVLRKAGVEAQLSMAGPNKERLLGPLIARTREILGDGVVHFSGSIPKANVGGFLSKHDIFLNTSRVDNAPVSVIEAMACGLCVVSTNAGGLPDILEDGVDSLLVPSGNSVAMAGAVLRLLKDPVLAARLSNNARRKAERYGWDSVVGEWVPLFADVYRSHSNAVRESE